MLARNDAETRLESRIVITGATGNTGKVIASLLRERGLPVVAMVRSERKRRELAAQGIETIAGDFDDPPSLERALSGAERAYLVCTPDEHLVRRETAFVRAAARARVRHVVKCSAYAAGVDAPTQNLRSHGLIERALIESGLEWTIVRPHGFMQTFTLIGWDLMQRSGVISFPAGDGALPLVDVRDVARVAALALTSSGHAGKAYDVTGPEALTFARQAEILGRVLGREIVYLPGHERELDLLLSLMGATPTPREHAIVIARMIREHRLERVHPTLDELGLVPTTFEQFVRDVVEGRTGGGNSFQPPDTPLFRAIAGVMPHVMRWRLRVRRWRRKND